MEMGSKWRKAKLALGLNSCMYVPQTLEEPSTSTTSPALRSSDAVLVSPSTSSSSSSRLLRLSKSGPKSCKVTCAICLNTMRPGQGHAIFTAECSHSFHFHCITSSVKHGNQVCPVCRAKWKEIPFQSPAFDHSHGKAMINPIPRDDAWMTVIRRLPSPQQEARRHTNLHFRAPEPPIFDDDEVLDPHSEFSGKRSSSKTSSIENFIGKIELKTYPEISAVPRAVSHDNFSLLIHFKAPFISGVKNCGESQTKLPSTPENLCASVDLVTVLDVSGSMAGTKLALLKRAMGFVIQNLGPSDRLSVIAFSSTARRIFPLRQMTETVRQESLQAINSLVSNGGTNIADGLRKGAKVLVDRKWKNPVCSIILLSDGQDTYTVNSPGGAGPRIDYKHLLPVSIHRNGGTGFQIPVHAFGFGSDHDASSMHSISEISGGTYSFIEAESVIQDAFAQCMGGLLSVVVQELKLTVECSHFSLQISSIKAGSYRSSVLENARIGTIDVGDLYAEEERDFLVTVNVPAVDSSDEMSLLKVKCAYRDPLTKDMVTSESSEVKILRPETTGPSVVSLEVDRQLNRLRTAEAMSEARVAADRGDLYAAVSVLQSCRRALSESASARAGDRLCISLCAELKEMQERMANRGVYEASGRAYVLSGLSSHSWQRATVRGDSTDISSLVRAYQTPSMVDMVTRSQTMTFGNPSSKRSLRAAMSFPASRSQPR
ncbi:E3 ubiquitin-protein ligase WAV3-like [Tripterygium wilfordii]|nr:E3 ubiquitin-protein ligase WAV3-like [Tripterygium wilfordii]